MTSQSSGIYNTSKPTLFSIQAKSWMKKIKVPCNQLSACLVCIEPTCDDRFAYIGTGPSAGDGGYNLKFIYKVYVYIYLYIYISISLAINDFEHVFVIGMMTSSNEYIFRVTGPLWGEFTGDSVTRSFNVFVDLRLNKRLSKPSRRRGFETHYDVNVMGRHLSQFPAASRQSSQQCKDEHDDKIE